MNVLQTKARPERSPGTTRLGGRGAAALAGVALAFAAVAGCGGGGPAASDTAATASPSVTAPSDPSAAGSGPGIAPGEPAPTPSAPDPRPTGPSAAPTPGTGPTPGVGPDGPQPTGPGIAPGEPAPVPGGRQTIGYQLSGNRLTVLFYGGICEKYGLKADESQPGRVTVRIVVAAPMPSGTACAAVAKRQAVTTDLKGPLMGRAVVDAATGAEVPLEAEVAGGPPVPADR
ncbi:hypothetical protein OG689_29585 [Kitasatospora sp. NBC_00240]|uniref:hypothetical protein n=1 Tax=Kitasatospora sp. NBC_00240 TaxID=2903567 RepID=UPI00225A6C5F|nr:hypothetical protein [Kitasatospora sp. NBC_00240]MCX5213369.1 hypothetical protein [Kitasatospora sp. NBC_00240]